MKSRLLLVALITACAAQNLLAQTQQVTFQFTGAPQAWVVPSGVTSITVDARGAQGGGNASAPTPQGGKGGRVQTTLAVTPGETLVIYVGGRGGDLVGPNTAGPGGFNGGGAGGVDNVDFNGPAGGGAGASDVRQGGDDLAHRVIVAGAGGGAECCVADSGGVGGDGGGITGMSGGSTGVSSAPGGGGTQTIGGAGGSGCNGNGGDGSLGQGGVGGNGNRAGGGGGGGYYGGGGGGGCLFGSGGGGGSSYSAGTNTVHTQGYQTGDGQVTITVPGSSLPPAPTISSFDPTDGFQGEHVFFFRVKGTNFQAGASVSFSGGQSVSVDQASLAVFSNEIDGNLVVAPTATPGSYDVTVANPDGQADTKQNALIIAVLPIAPVNLTARVGDRTVNLSWNSPRFAPEAYNIYVSLVASDGSVAPFAEFPQVQGTTFSLTPLNSTLQNGKFYRFAVSALAGGLESSQSLPVFAEPGKFAFPGPPPHPLHPILFLHGINSNASTWSTTEDFMRNSLTWVPGGTFSYRCSDQPATDPPQALNFTQGGDFFDVNFADSLANCSSNSSQGIFRQGDEVGGFIRALHPRGPLSIVSHSMGGLAARAYISANPSSATNDIADLLMYGTPEKGIDLAYLQLELEKASLFPLAPFILDYLNVYNTAVSQGARDMDSDCGTPSLFLSQINAQMLPQGIRYTLIRGHSSYLFLTDHIDECNPQSGATIQTDAIVPLNSVNLNGVAPPPPSASPVILDTDKVHFVDETSDFPAILCALDPNCLQYKVMSPVDIQVTSPSGGTISSNLTSMPGAEYMNVIDPNGHQGATILIPFPEGGQYTVAATPKSGAQLTDTFTILQIQNGVTTTIAANMRIQDIPSDGFHPHVNSRPVASAGADQTVECSSNTGTTVLLNGSASADSDGDSLTYKWTDENGNILGSTAVLNNVRVPLGTHSFTLTVADPTALSSTATTHVTVRDTTKPVLSLSTSTVTAIISTASASTMPLSLAGIALTSDVCDGSPSLTNNAPAQFPIGSTTVTFTATDHSGNTSQRQLTVKVVYKFAGFFSPIPNANFTAGNTVPVKFQLTAADGTIVTNAVATLQAFLVTSSGTLQPVPVRPAGTSNNGNFFTYDPMSKQYVYNLSTKGYARGNYVLRATVNDTTTHDVRIALK